MPYKTWADETLNRILNKLETTSVSIGARFPHQANEDIYDEQVPCWWTNGFWPGILWLCYKHTGREIYADLANEVEDKMDSALDEFVNLHHDVGFMWLLSSGGNLRYKNNQKSRLRLLKTASLLAGRFNLKGGYLRAWNEDKPGQAIIDCTMNLALLYWAAKETGDPRFLHIAEAHADTVVKYFVRPDGSSCHIVAFDPETGEHLGSLGGQGAAPDSAWSRGCSWALYGLTLAYKYIGKDIYLETAKRVANFFIANLPEDMVSHWDFRVERTPETPKDTSASACAACGLLELAKYLPEVEGAMYTEKAYRILRSLTDNYSNLDNSKQALLGESVRSFPGNMGINVGLIYGDYFYLEGISRLTGNSDILWIS